MRYDAQHKQMTREELLALAGDTLRAEGPEKVGVAAITAKGVDA